MSSISNLKRASLLYGMRVAAYIVLCKAFGILIRYLKDWILPLPILFNENKSFYYYDSRSFCAPQGLNIYRLVRRKYKFSACC